MAEENQEEILNEPLLSNVEQLLPDVEQDIHLLKNSEMFFPLYRNSIEMGDLFATYMHLRWRMILASLILIGFSLYFIMCHRIKTIGFSDLYITNEWWLLVFFIMVMVWCVH